MEEQSTICPYTGLRPFTEDESLYFKGRDEHITQATNQLAKNKFIMLTGASGDGKSSLVYAGIVPNAKAGFLRSQFSNWVVADFRPERNPMGNLSHALAKQLGIANENTVRTELSHGFSALVDVYKASPLYLDTVEEDFSTLDDQQKSKRKRTAANLIIIADQFEEFFTNPENFHKGIPSQEANLVTNLLLETARIALEEKLPIYVIITMRSDFIGQCASFRGLPEAIGFSQFFVPRLNRTQLQEVIEEPAVLSGNKISRRLTERLIYDMVEGTDQLPILQHALNQIWKMANEGRSEMDLLHYAMVGGMKGTELQEKEAADFEKWFRDLPANIQACYQQPGLQNVLNTHANKLNNFALSDKNVNEADTQQIVETAFKCLTKIDNSRAVRNRMTLKEITAVINQPNIDYKKVGQVLSVFREPGNTLLRPFTDEVPELSGESVLDITHESLIRNWGNLSQWAKDEFNSYTIYLDFSQQLNRWVDSDRDSSFLLYIGPLTFFENWFEKAKPNTEWIARYLGEELDHEQRQAKATSILNNANEFLQRSARKHAVTRAVMKYGPGKIAAAFAVLAFIGLSSFAFKTYLDRRNVAVLEDIKEQSFSLFNNPKLYFAERARLATEQLRSNITTIPELIDNVRDPIEKIVMANGIAAALVFEGRTEPAREIAQAIAVTDSLLSVFKPDFNDGKKISSYLKEVNEWRATLGLAYFYNSTAQLMQLQQKNARRSAEAVIAIIQNTPRNFEDILSFTTSLETALNFNSFSEEELKTVIQSLSPFETSSKTEWVTTHFKRDKLLIRGYQGYGFNFNGLYQELALLYAADGNVARSLQAIDTLLKYTEPYYQRDYTNMLDNAANVASVLFRNGHTDLVNTFVTGYCKNKKMTEIEFYQRLLGRAQPYNLSRNSNYQVTWSEAHNINLSYGEEKEISFYYQKFREAANRSSNPNEQKFLLALSYKDEAITIAHKAEVAGKKYNREVVTALFDKSIVHYKKVDINYLNEFIDQTITASADMITAPRSRLFLFPDLIYPFVPHGPRDFHFNYMSVCFMEYTIDKNLFSSYYKETEELKLFETWLTDYHYHTLWSHLFMRSHADFNLLAKIESELAKLDADSQVDLNLLYLYLGQYAVDIGNESLALQYYSKLHVENFGNQLRFKISSGLSNNTSFALIMRAFTFYLQKGQQQEAKHILDFFKNPVNRSTLYAAAAVTFSVQQIKGSLVTTLLDSALLEMNRVENLNSEQPNRFRIALALLTYAPTERSIEQAQGIIKNQALKFPIQQRMAQRLAYRGELFKATEVIQANLSDSDQLDFLWHILHGHANSKPTAPEWREYENIYEFWKTMKWVPYVDETN
jgi:energy-coupling factor transporter ATP-binding protein EcfA2